MWKLNRNNVKNEKVLKLQAAVIHKNKRNAAGKSEKVVNPYPKQSRQSQRKGVSTRAKGEDMTGYEKNSFCI